MNAVAYPKSIRRKLVALAAASLVGGAGLAAASALPAVAAETGLSHVQVFSNLEECYSGAGKVLVSGGTITGLCERFDDEIVLKWND